MQTLTKRKKLPVCCPQARGPQIGWNQKVDVDSQLPQHQLSEECLQTDHALRLKGVPHSLKGVPHSLKGVPHSLKGVPHSLKGIPHSLKGVPHSLKGIPHSLKGIPHSLKGVPRSLKGISPLWPPLPDRAISCFFLLHPELCL